MKLSVWGANPTHAFHGDECIFTPTEVELPDEGDELVWMGWSSAIGKQQDGRLFRLGATPPEILTSPKVKVRKIIGGDNALACLDSEGYIHVLPKISDAYDAVGAAPTTRSTSVSRWADVVASETAVLGLTPTGLLYRSTSIDSILNFDSAIPSGEGHTEVERIPLPPLSVSSLKLYALETRLFIHVAGAGMQQLLEIVSGFDDLGLGLQPETEEANSERSADSTDEENRARLVAIYVESLSFTVITGPKNRLGVLCDTGEAYLLDSRTRELERLDVSDRNTAETDTAADSDDELEDGQEDAEVRYLGIGSGFEVLVRNDGVWIKGDNIFGQQGNGTMSEETADTFSRLDIDVDRVTGILCSRWTTALVMS